MELGHPRPALRSGPALSLCWHGKCTSLGARKQSVRRAYPAEATVVLIQFPIRIGEKMIDWSDETPSIETILGNVSLYWFTGCYPSSIYPYREVSDHAV